MNSPTLPLNGLARRLVYDGILDEDTLRQAQANAEKEKKGLVSHLVSNKLAEGLSIAEAAADEFGIPFLDLPAYDANQAPHK
ncbi:MAG: type IV-A pilus assembly ATPase PilB, partial [Spongiibacteraceae bacterium]